MVTSANNNTAIGLLQNLFGELQAEAAVRTGDEIGCLACHSFSASFITLMEILLPFGERVRICRGLLRESEIPAHITPCPHVRSCMVFYGVSK